MSNRALQFGGLAVAGGIGYYMYRAGGDPKTAEKKFEADAAKVSNKVQNNLPGSGKEAKKEAEAAGSQAGAKLEQYGKEAESKAKEAKAELEKQANKTGRDLQGAVDKFDKNVEEGASKAKGTISSWLGGK